MLIYLALLLVAALFARALQGRWLAPAPMFAAYWAVAAALPVLLLPGFHASATALIYVLVAVVVFTLGSYTATAVPAGISRKEEMEPPILHRAGTLRVLVRMGALAGLAATALALRTHGFNLADVATLGGLLDAGNALSVARYADDAGSHPLVPLLLAFAYAACMAAPFALLDEKRRAWRRLASVAPLLSVVLYSAVTTARLGMLVGAALTVSAYIAMRLLRDGNVPALSGRFLFGSALAACALAVSFAAIAFVRIGRIDSQVIPVVTEKLTIYAFGYLPGFSQWLEVYRVDPPPLGWGTSSLAGMEFITGLDRGATRAYDERVNIDAWGTTTNIYTWFRNLLLDFSEPGAILFLAVAGFLISYAYRAARLDASPTAAAILACGYSIILLSNTMLITTFANVVAGMLLGIWAVWLAFKPNLTTPASRHGRRAQFHLSPRTADTRRR